MEAGVVVKGAPLVTMFGIDVLALTDDWVVDVSASVVIVEPSTGGVVSVPACVLANGRSLPAFALPPIGFPGPTPADPPMTGMLYEIQIESFPSPKPVRRKGSLRAKIALLGPLMYMSIFLLKKLMIQ